jgi:hypothetical protein
MGCHDYREEMEDAFKDPETNGEEEETGEGDGSLREEDPPEPPDAEVIVRNFPARTSLLARDREDGGILCLPR